MAKAKTKKANKKLTLTIEVPDEKYFKHIADAYGLVSMYRTHQKAPHEKMELWLLRLVVEGANAIYNFHNENVKAAQQQATEASRYEREQKEKSKEEGQSQEGTAEVSETSEETDKLGE